MAKFSSAQWENQSFRTGYRTGMVSPNNVIFNASGDPAAILCDRAFSLQSAFITAAIFDGQVLNMKAFAGGELLYSKTLTLSVDLPSFVEFNWQNIDRVEFNSSGSQIAIDNLTVEVPGALPENEPVNTPTTVPPIDLGRVVVNSIGVLKPVIAGGGGPIVAGPSGGPNYYMIDQARYSSGGAILPNVDVNWDTNSSFTVTLPRRQEKNFSSPRHPTPWLSSPHFFGGKQAIAAASAAPDLFL